MLRKNNQFDIIFFIFEYTQNTLCMNVICLKLVLIYFQYNCTKMTFQMIINVPMKTTAKRAIQIPAAFCPILSKSVDQFKNLTFPNKL